MVLKSVYEADGFMAATKADLRNVQRVVFGFVGKYWHRFFKKIKFTKRGAALYKFAPRSGEAGSGRRFKGSYNEAKLLKKENGQGVTAIGETKPNVWSGRSRASAMASQKVVAKARSSGQGSVEVIINAPALNFRNPKSKANPRKDVTSTVPAELQQLEAVGIKQFDRKLTRIRKRKTFRS